MKHTKKSVPLSNEELKSQDEHIQDKSMWMGGTNPILQTHYIVDHDNGQDPNKFIKSECVVIPRVLNMAMELLINVCDVSIRSGCNQLEVEFHKDNSLVVKNYSPGFQVRYHELSKLWDPFIKTAVLFQGSEHKKPTNAITGGTNGVGLKATVRNVLFMTVITVDPETGLAFLIKYTRNNRKPTQLQIKNATMFDSSVWPFDYTDPQIIDLTSGPVTIADFKGENIVLSREQPFTSIQILPDYDTLKMDNNMLQMFRSLVESRCYQIACQLHCPIYFNRRKIMVSSLIEYSKWRAPDSKRFIEFEMDPCNIGKLMYGDNKNDVFNNPTKLAYPCKVVIAIKDTPGTMQKWSIINAVPVEHGNHFSHFTKMIEDAVKNRMKNTFKNGFEFHSSLVNTGYDIFISMHLSCPDWSQQTKSSVDVDKHIMDMYTIPESNMNTIIDELKKNVEVKKFDKLRVDLNNALKTTRDKIARDYTPAGWSAKGTSWSKKSQTTCFLTEGTSAKGMIRTAIGSKKSPYNFNNSGILSLGGVPLNVSRNLEKIPGGIDIGSKNLCMAAAQPGYIFSREFAENVVWQTFVKVMNLDYQKRYFTQADMQTLSVAKLIIAVDQDLDGMGNILTLIMNFIYVFWPELYANGWVYWLSTPVVRVLKNRKIIAEFYYESEFKKWALEQGYYDLLTDDMEIFEDLLIKQNPTWSELDVITYIDKNHKSSKNLNVEFFKGLDGHSKNMIEHMFMPDRIKNNIFRVVLDDNSPLLFKEMFDNDSEPRKKWLRAPQVVVPNPTENIIYCTNILLGPLMWYSRDDLRRKLMGIDGFNDVRRRIVYGLILYHKSSPGFSKTYMVASYIAQHTSYHHGDKSITDTLTKLGARYYGSNQVLLAEQSGGLGSRVGDSKKNAGAGAPRYTSIRLNKPVVEKLFPFADFDVLEFMVEDGERTIPKYFAPVIVPIYETISRPSHGWNINTHAIYYKDVINLSRAMVTSFKNGDQKVFPIGSDFKSQCPLNPNTIGWKGKTISFAGKALSVGVYTFYPDTLDVIISELPMGMSVPTYINHLRTLAMNKETKKLTESHPFIANITDDHGILDQSSGEPLADNEIFIKFKIKPEAVVNLTKCVINDVMVTGELAGAYNLGLVEYINHNINILRPDDTVAELTSYYQVADMWFPIRYETYSKRIIREDTLLTLYIAYFKQTLKFIRECKTDFNKIHSEEIAEQILSEQGYMRFNNTLLHNPGHKTSIRLVRQIVGLDIQTFLNESETNTSKNQLYSHFGQSGVDSQNKDERKINYDYLMNIKTRDKLQKNVEKIEKDLAAKESRLAEIRNPEYLCNLWLSDIAGLEKVLDEHCPTLWNKLDVEY